MSDPFSFNIRGAAALTARLNQLPRDVATKVGQAAVRAGGKQVLTAVRAHAPDGPDAEGSKRTRNRKGGRKVEETHHKIKNSLKIKKARTKDNGVVGVSIHAGDAYHAHMVEFGSIHNKPNNFMQRGLDASAEAAQADIAKYLDRGLTKKGV